jgi:hypothetical protein
VFLAHGFPDQLLLTFLDLLVCRKVGYVLGVVIRFFSLGLWSAVVKFFVLQGVANELRRTNQDTGRKIVTWR